MTLALSLKILPLLILRFGSPIPGSIRGTLLVRYLALWTYFFPAVLGLICCYVSSRKRPNHSRQGNVKQHIGLERKKKTAHVPLRSELTLPMQIALLPYIFYKTQENSGERPQWCYSIFIQGDCKIPSGPVVASGKRPARMPAVVVLARSVLCVGCALAECSLACP